MATGKLQIDVLNIEGVARVLKLVIKLLDALDAEKMYKVSGIKSELRQAIETLGEDEEL